MHSNSQSSRPGFRPIPGFRGGLAVVLVVAGCLFGLMTAGAWAGPLAMIQPPENAAEVQAVIVRVSWATLRAAPSPKGKAIGIAFGNDAFPVLERKGEWVRVRLPNQRPAWLPAEALEEEAPLPSSSIADAVMPAEASGPGGRVRRPPPVVTQLSELRAPVLSNAQQALLKARGFQAAGFRVRAREVYIDIILRHPDTPAFYQAVRGMNFYYPLGNFPRVVGERLPKDGMALAQAKLPELFIREGEACLEESRALDAAAAFEMALLHGGGMWARATSGLKDALRAAMNDSQEQETGARELAHGLWREYFPDEPLPKRAEVAAASAETSREDPGAWTTP